MKLIFFIIGFSIIFLRVYFPWSGIFKNDPRTVTITVSDGSNYMQIRYAGKVTLSDDESSFASISPGGYVKFRKNEIKVLAEGNLKGGISYELSDDGESLPYDDHSKQLVAVAIKTMIAYGFDAEPRMERVFRRGGVKALLDELEILQSTPLGIRYAHRIIATDTLQTNELNTVIDHIGSFMADHDKVSLFNTITTAQLSDSNTIDHFCKAIETMRGDVDKINVLNHVLNSDTLTPFFIDRIISISARFTADVDKQQVFRKLINRKDLNSMQRTRIIELVPALRSAAEQPVTP